MAKYWQRSENVKQTIEEIYPQIVEIRRYLHKNPELSYQEEKTALFVAEQLRSLGLEVKTHVGGVYGVTGTLRGAKPGPTVALRADMDALPIQDGKKVEYRSQNDGVMHACGHDGHTAILLGVAKLLVQLKEQIEGQVLFIFQPAEEVPPGGAIAMVNAGVLEGVDAIFGLHLWAPHSVGTIAVKSDELMAAADNFTITIQGKGGHGGMPHFSVDPIVVASHLVIQLQSIISRQVDPLQPAVISVCKIEAGDSFNVIPDQCRLMGTVRTFDKQVRDSIVERIQKIAHGVGEAFGATCILDYNYGYPAVINDKEQTELLQEVAKEIVGEEKVLSFVPVTGGEDFSYYLERIPGAFCFVGSASACTYQGSHHHPRFDIDEESLKVGMELLAKLAIQYLQRKQLVINTSASVF